MTVVQHIILGTHYLDHVGTLYIRSSAAPQASSIRFKEPFFAFTAKQVHQVTPGTLSLHPTPSACHSL